MTLKIIFAGTPQFSVPVLQALLDSPHEIVAVYTQPDRPAGRGRQLQMSPIKQLALAHHLPIEQPQTLRDPTTQEHLKSYAADLMVVVAYGLLLPQKILAMPKLGCINVHASLLPRWRGASPIQQAILAGDEITGVTIMQMTEGLDAGPMLAMAITDIQQNDNSQTLHDRLAIIGAELLLQVITDVENNLVLPQPQNLDEVTYAPKIKKTDARINWQHSAIEIERQIKAYYGWPVAFTQFDDTLMRIWDAKAINKTHDLEPGTLLISDQQLEVVCRTGVLQLQQVQLAGGRMMMAQDFLNAMRGKLSSDTLLK